jgi:hypothetical protein
MSIVLKDLKPGDMFYFSSLGPDRTYMVIQQPTSGSLYTYVGKGEAMLLLHMEELRVCREHFDSGADITLLDNTS